jgi:hypothetical protein
MLQLILVVPSVLAFGGAGDTPACDACICAADPGDEMDINDKKCCPDVAGQLSDRWDAFCGALAFDECTDECYEDPSDSNSLILVSPFDVGPDVNLAYNGWGSAGLNAPCMVGYGTCAAGLVCTPGIYGGFCMGEPMATSQKGRYVIGSDQSAVQMANQLSASGIEFLAVDWDKTAHTEHTFGIAPSSLEALVHGVSPDFISLVSEWCGLGKAYGIVTYNDIRNVVYISGQKYLGPDMIKKVLSEVLPEQCPVIVSADNMHRYTPQRTSQGKMPHILDAMQQFGVSFSGSQVLLVDDTLNNIQVAQGQYSTAHVNPDRGMYLNHIQSMNTPGRG